LRDFAAKKAPTARVRVAAIYRDLRSSPDQPWWCADKEIYRGPPGAQFSNVAVAPVLLGDAATVIRAATGQFGTFNGAPLNIVATFPLADPHLSLESAEALLPRIDKLKASLDHDQGQH